MDLIKNSLMKNHMPSNVVKYIFTAEFFISFD